MSNTKIRLAIAAAVVVFFFSSAGARAQSSPPPSFAPTAAPGGGFGGAGQWVLSLGGTADEYAFFHKQSGGGWQLQLQPAVDYFLIPSLSIGGVVGFRHDSGGDTNVSFGARAGFNLNINEKVGWWPMAGIYASRHSSNGHDSDSHASLAIFAPFLYHLVPHFFVGLGPSFSLGLNGGTSNQFGIDAVLGGWI